MYLIFPQTLLFFFLILVLRVGGSPTREGPSYATAFLSFYYFQAKLFHVHDIGKSHMTISNVLFETSINVWTLSDNKNWCNIISRVFIHASIIFRPRHFYPPVYFQNTGRPFQRFLTENSWSIYTLAELDMLIQLIHSGDLTSGGQSLVFVPLRCSIAYWS